MEIDEDIMNEISKIKLEVNSKEEFTGDWFYKKKEIDAF